MIVSRLLIGLHFNFFSHVLSSTISEKELTEGVRYLDNLKFVPIPEAKIIFSPDFLTGFLEAVEP